jgi:hypothetical protein
MQLNILSENEFDISVTQLQNISKSNNQLRSIGGELAINYAMKSHLLVGSHFANATWVTKSTFWLEHCVFPEIGVGADWFLAAKLINFVKIHRTNVPLYSYRKHSDQSTRKKMLIHQSIKDMWKSINEQSGYPKLNSEFGTSLVFPHGSQCATCDLKPLSKNEVSNWYQTFKKNNSPDASDLAARRIAASLYAHGHRKLVWSEPDYLKALGEMIKDRSFNII